MSNMVQCGFCGTKYDSGVYKKCPHCPTLSPTMREELKAQREQKAIGKIEGGKMQRGVKKTDDEKREIMRKIQADQEEGSGIVQACKNNGISDVTYYLWKKQLSGGTGGGKSKRTTVAPKPDSPECKTAETQTGGFKDALRQMVRDIVNEELSKLLK